MGGGGGSGGLRDEHAADARREGAGVMGVRSGCDGRHSGPETDAGGPAGECARPGPRMGGDRGALATEALGCGRTEGERRPPRAAAAGGWRGFVAGRSEGMMQRSWRARSDGL